MMARIALAMLMLIATAGCVSVERADVEKSGASPAHIEEFAGTFRDTDRRGLWNVLLSDPPRGPLASERFVRLEPHAALKRLTAISIEHGVEKQSRVLDFEWDDGIWTRSTRQALAPSGLPVFLLPIYPFAYTQWDLTIGLDGEGNLLVIEKSATWLGYGPFGQPPPDPPHPIARRYERVR
jgi:hypothetical protein